MKGSCQEPPPQQRKPVTPSQGPSSGDAPNQSLLWLRVWESSPLSPGVTQPLCWGWRTTDVAVRACCWESRSRMSALCKRAGGRWTAAWLMGNAAFLLCPRAALAVPPAPWKAPSPAPLRALFLPTPRQPPLPVRGGTFRVRQSLLLLPTAILRNLRNTGSPPFRGVPSRCAMQAPTTGQPWDAEVPAVWSETRKPRSTAVPSQRTWRSCASHWFSPVLRCSSRWIAGSLDCHHPMNRPPRAPHSPACHLQATQWLCRRPSVSVVCQRCVGQGPFRSLISKPPLRVCCADVASLCLRNWCMPENHMFETVVGMHHWLKL